MGGQLRWNKQEAPFSHQRNYHQSDGEILYLWFHLNFFIKNVGGGYEPYFKMKVEVDFTFENLPGEISEFLNHYKNSGPFKGNGGVYEIPNKSPLFQDEETMITHGSFRIDKNKILRMRDSIVKATLYYSSGIMVKEFNLFALIESNGKTIEELYEFIKK